ncbi:MAG: DUF885 domain-containing protein [Gemmatimonadetes bacterium]|nr:DUF885 domain-containing protein [Gemmatimonadota bacterium]
MHRAIVWALASLATGVAALAGQGSPAGAAASYVPDPAALRAATASELRNVVERFSADRAALRRRYRVEYSPARRSALRDFYAGWLATLRAVNFDALSQDGRVDYLLLQNELDYGQRLLARDERLVGQTGPLMPFAKAIMDLDESRRRFETNDPAVTARTLARLADDIGKSRQVVEAGTKPDSSPGALRPTKIVAFRAAAMLTDLRGTLEGWFKFYDGYDPLFTWWAKAPYQKADSALRGYVQLLREKVVGARPGEDEPIVGLPIGREALLEDLINQLIPYTPEELIAIAQRELAWCEAEMKKAAREMGLGDDWKAALERVKSDHVPPGRQPELVRDLARETVDFLERHDLVTVPPLARDIWRMEMLSPERQKEAPFFLGGEVVQVSFPTSTMSEEDKLMSMRGNNIHFSRAVVHHELIPGHHLQGFMTDRYNPHRGAFATPFWHEGNAFYWETLLWDLGFPRTPEDRIGMLFWRMHRAARIVFSMSFHLGQMTPQQAIDFLVDRVGHERANATAEVRRSFNGDYSPLYQVAYMIGGLQFRALHRELVQSGKMTNRAFHDAILQSGSMPVEMVRALLAKQQLTRDYRARWRFAGEAPGH